MNEAPTAVDAAFVLAENSARRHRGGLVSASDVDAGDALSYAITAGNASGAFAIDSATGEITVADSSQLDFETTPVFNLTVTVTDSGGLTDDAAVTVSLTDLNEAPTAVDAAFVLAENSADGTVVGTVSASDVDAGDSLSYAITGGDPAGAFSIDAATGEITVADSTPARLRDHPRLQPDRDRDGLGRPDGRRGGDGESDGRERGAHGRGRRLRPGREQRRRHRGGQRLRLGRGRRRLALLRDHGWRSGGAFAIDAATGEITVADSSQLDFETTPVFNLTVTVTDSGGLTDDAAVTVSLTDVNEAPTAVDAAFVLAENSADGTVVGSVSASDVDAGDSLSYAITAGDPAEPSRSTRRPARSRSPTRPSSTSRPRRSST